MKFICSFQLVLKDKDTKEEIKLYVNRWLADEEDDMQISREIAIPKEDKEVQLPGMSVSLMI